MRGSTFMLRVLIVIVIICLVGFHGVIRALVLCCCRMQVFSGFRVEDFERGACRVNAS